MHIWKWYLHWHLFKKKRFAEVCPGYIHKTHWCFCTCCRAWSSSMVDKLKYFTITSMELTCLEIFHKHSCCNEITLLHPLLVSLTFQQVQQHWKCWQCQIRCDTSVCCIQGYQERRPKQPMPRCWKPILRSSWMLRAPNDLYIRWSTPKNPGFSFLINTRVNLGSRYLHYLHIMKPGAWKWLSAVIQIL